MVSKNELASLAERASRLADNLLTEEATKHALVLPFIQAIGYDIFDPTEVVPEFTADYGVKQGEKVDYAIVRNGVPAILIECKKISDSLDITRASQLSRYFHNTSAHVGILTNGVVYQFFSDLDEDNKMDEDPFLEIDIRDLDNRDYNSLNHFAKHSFDIDEARVAASNMKYIRGMKGYLEEIYVQPDGEFIELLARKVFSGRMTQARIDSFTGLVKLAVQGFVNDRINSTLRQAIAHTVDEDAVNAPVHGSSQHETATSTEAPVESKGIVTTVEEMEAFEMVKTVLANTVSSERIVIRDTTRHCGIILDNNQRRPICRLYFNAALRKYFGVFDEFGNETRYLINDLEDISEYREQLQATVARYTRVNG